MKRILITGSRDWTNVGEIMSALNHIVTVDLAHLPGPVTIVSGACPTGADSICEEVAIDMGWNVERHPANWDLYGRRAGYVRNAEMVSLGADICLAFIKNDSKGARMTAQLAHDAGIETIVLAENGLVRT